MAPESGGERVLIADADPGVRKQLSKRLLDAGVFADPVADGKLALEQLREQTYSVILLDLSLPGVGAEQILDFVSASPAKPRPVILVVAAGAVSRTLDVDLVQIVLRKPCNLGQLAELIESCVRTAAHHRGLLNVPRVIAEGDAALVVS
jgi:DNA-binding response OmpR family regulator